MAVWEAGANEVLYSAFNQSGNTEAIDAYVSTGNFLRDYVSYVNILGIFPHPKIVKNLRVLLADIAKEDEVNRAKAASKKRGIKKVPTKRSVVLEEVSSQSKKNPVRKDDADGKAKEEANAEIDIASLSHLQYSDIVVRNWKIDNGTARGLSLALQNATSVRSLDFYNVELSDESLRYTLDAITRNTSLQSLSLSSNVNLAPYMSSLSQTTFANIQQLSLQSNGIDDAVVSSLFDLIVPATQLVALDFWDNKIGDAGATAAAALLRNNTSLTSLSLGKNCIGDAGAEALASCLGRYALSADETAARKKLKADLEFKKKENERRKKKGAASTISPNPPLARTKSQDKNPANAPNQETQAKRKGKKNEPTIDEQIAALSPAEEIDGVWYVDGNRALLSLNLRMNKITDKGGAAILHMIEVNYVIQRCVTEYNPVSDDMRFELAEALVRRDEEEEEETVPMEEYELDQPLVYTQDPPIEM